MNQQNLNIVKFNALATNPVRWKHLTCKALCMSDNNTQNYGDTHTEPTLNDQQEYRKNH